MDDVPETEALSAAAAPAEEVDELDDGFGDQLLDHLISDEMGDRMAAIMRTFRRAQEAWYREAHPGEGLRERKRRLTRQLISDVATTLFAARGFDNVKVSEIAERVGVSEKTVYNYFPTKESLVLDYADEGVEQLARALRERRPDQSPTEAVVEAIKADARDFDVAPDAMLAFLPMFGQLIESTPALRAAWLELHDRLATVARDELAAQAGVDPRDPEPTVAGRALAGLAELSMQSHIRHIRAGLRGTALREAVEADLDRGARLLETGLWSFNLPRGTRARSQALEAARAAEEARVQVLRALRQARAAWEEVRREGRPTESVRQAQREVRESFREAHRNAREAQRNAREAQRQVHEALREVKRQARDHKR